MPHVFIFAFTLLLVTAMELTWPVKGKSFVQRDGVECATATAVTEEVPKIFEYEEEVEE